MSRRTGTAGFALGLRVSAGNHMRILSSRGMAARVDNTDMLDCDFSSLTSRVKALFEENRVTVGGYQYTRPAPEQYPHQWLWDSCFHAIVLKHFDPAAAQKELLSLIAHQVRVGLDAGMIPHMTYWDGTGKELWGKESHSTITQPPLLAVAAFEVWKRTRDFQFLEDMYPAIVAYHEWFDRRRTVHNDGIVSIVHPWESGWDASPRWDPLLGKQKDPTTVSPEWRKQHMSVVEQFRWDAARLGAAGHFCVQPADFNAIRLRDLEVLARIAAMLEFQEDTRLFGRKVEFIRQSMRDKMWSESDACFYDLQSSNQAQIAVQSSASAIALFGGVPDSRQAKLIVHALRSPDYSLPFGIPTTPRSHPDFSPSEYWRGNIWPSVTWLLHRGLKRYAFDCDARIIARSFGQLVTRNGFHEYFDPISGKGLGPDKQTWTSLALDLLEEEGLLTSADQFSGVF